MEDMDRAFANQRNATSLARFIVYEVQAWMGDCLLVVYQRQIAQSNAYFLFSKIYRLYHVCGRKWCVIAAPCAMCTALVGEHSIPSFDRARRCLRDHPSVRALFAEIHAGVEFPRP